jgi:hypothetical protein
MHKFLSPSDSLSEEQAGQSLLTILHHLPIGMYKDLAQERRVFILFWEKLGGQEVSTKEMTFDLITQG